MSAARAPSAALWAAGLLATGSLAVAATALLQTRTAHEELATLQARLEAMEERQGELAAAGPVIRTDDGDSEALVEQWIAVLEGEEPPSRDLPAGAGTAAVAGSAAARPLDVRRGPRPRFFEEATKLLEGTPTERLAAARQLGANGPPGLRLGAARALLELEPEEGVEAIRELVEDTSGTPRAERLAVAAIEMLGDIGGREAQDQLYAFYGSTSPAQRRAAARGLETLGDPEPMTRLVADLSDQLQSPDGGVRSRTAQELGLTRSSTAVPSLVGLLSDGNSEVRLRAAEALGRTADPAAIPELQRLLDDPIAQVRDQAAESMDQIRNPRPDNRLVGFGGPGLGMLFR